MTIRLSFLYVEIKATKICPNLQFQEHIEAASAVLSQSVSTIDRFRRKSGGLVDTLGKMVKKQVILLFQYLADDKALMYRIMTAIQRWRYMQNLLHCMAWSSEKVFCSGTRNDAYNLKRI